MGLEFDFENELSGKQNSNSAMSVKLNKQQEADLIRELEQQSISQLEVDIEKELEDTLKHRTEAQQTLKGKVHYQKIKINSSNFEQGRQQAAQAIKKRQLANAPNTQVSAFTITTPTVKTQTRQDLKQNQTPSPHISPVQPSSQQHNMSVSAHKEFKNDCLGFSNGTMSGTKRK